MWHAHLCNAPAPPLQQWPPNKSATKDFGCTHFRSKRQPIFKMRLLGGYNRSGLWLADERAGRWKAAQLPPGSWLYGAGSRIFQGQRLESLRLTGGGRWKARLPAWNIQAARSSEGTGQDAKIADSDKSAGMEYDFVTEVLRDKPPQVVPKYLVGDQYYTLKEKQLLKAPFWRKLTRAIQMQIEALRDKNGADVEGLKEEGNMQERKGLQQSESENSQVVREDTKPARPVYISELLREYKGNLYVPEEAFKKPVSELEEFNRDLESLPEMSLDQFLKAMNANQVKLLTSRGISTPRKKYTYWDFVVELRKIPGEQRLQKRKWAMHLNDKEAKTLLKEYAGPQREVETSVTPYILPPSVAPHPVAESISGRVVMEVTVIASIISAAAFSIGGMASVGLFTLASACSVVIVHVLWPIAGPLVRPFFFLAMRVVEGFWSILTRLGTGGGAGKKGVPALLLEGYRYLASGALYSSARTLGAILFVLIAMAALAKFTLTRRPKDFTKWDLWQAIDFGHSKPQARVEGTTGVGFADVAGIDDVVEELQELVSYLKDPERFNQMGTKPPHGVLLEGPPGCGKTLLAKAIAGEAGVPFYQMAGSEFVEVLVGVGAARVRDLFKRAKVNRPSVVFIDEIDALGAMRSGATGEEGAESYSAGAQERETTLNQLLIELDGFDTGKGVVFLGATNRMDMLDPALLRPGRFDRKIAIRPPRAKGRLEILKVHAKSVKLSPTVDLWLYAKNLPGWTGAELAQLLQEAALVAVRHGGNIIMRPDMDQALDRLTMGPERLGLERRQPVHRRMATHQVGMAMASHILRRVENAETEFCDRVSIVPRGETLSRTIFERLDDEAYLFNKRPSLIHRLKVMLAGRAAEEVMYGRDTSTFSEQHLADATWLARKLISIWNLDGPITMHGDRNPWEHQEHGFSGPPLGFEGGLYNDYGFGDKPLNYALCDDVAARTKHLLDTAYREIFSLLQLYQAAIAKAIYVVMDREELIGEELDHILDNYPAGTPFQLVEDEEEPGELQISDSQELSEETLSRSFDSAESTNHSPSAVLGGDEFSRGSADQNGNGEIESRLTMPEGLPRIDGSISNGNGNRERGGHLYMAEDLATISGDVVAATSRSASGEVSCDVTTEKEHTIASSRTGKSDVD